MGVLVSKYRMCPGSIMADCYHAATAKGSSLSSPCSPFSNGDCRFEKTLLVLERHASARAFSMKSNESIEKTRLIDFKVPCRSR